MRRSYAVEGRGKERGKWKEEVWRHLLRVKD